MENTSCLNETNAAEPALLYQVNSDHDACGLGLIVDGKAEPKHEIVRSALLILERLAHRGATGADGNTGDGAGILTQIPDAFFRKQQPLLPEQGQYAVASVFLPRDAPARERILLVFRELAEPLGLRVIYERDVPVNPGALGPQALASQPRIEQWFLVSASALSPEDWDCRLYLLRQASERALRGKKGVRDERTGRPHSQFYVASLSVHTIVYKGLLQPEQLSSFYPDLTDPEFRSACALVHSRFSTNTLPAWELAHPYRYLCHNGEINTLRGNLLWMRAREGAVARQLSPERPDKLLPLIADGQSDSQCLDNMVEILVRSGRALPHALMMATPEVAEDIPTLSQARKDFQEFHALRLEPWDGPAALGFCDGKWIGACLDRNGLRPCRYDLLQDGTLILASEAGALPVPEEKVLRRGRLQPGEMIAVNLKEACVYSNEEIRARVAAGKPFFEEGLIDLSALPPPRARVQGTHPLRAQLQRFGYTTEELQKVVLPMLEAGEEASSSMGNDTPLAVLSDRPEILFKYFRQMFAQVTNPPIDPERERLVMSLTTYLGPRAGLFSKNVDGIPRLRLRTPLLTAREFSQVLESGPSSHTISLLLPREEDLPAALERVSREAEIAARQGVQLLVLSDRRVGDEGMALPSLLAVSAVHHHLLGKGLRMEVSLVADTGEARDTHHFACLLGFGADAIHAYLIPPLARRLQEDGRLPREKTPEELEQNFIKAVDKGLRKVLSKMGISTLASYRGAQIFEILGLGREITERFFPYTPSLIGGLGFAELQKETELRHFAPLPESETGDLLTQLPLGGEIHYRPGNQTHFWNPTTITKLQIATRQNNPRTYEEFSEAVKSLSRFTLRGWLAPVPSRQPVPLDEVESVTEILRRFNTGAMSFGSLGKEAHETLAVAMNRLGAKSNSGEGGEDAARFQPDDRGDSRNSAIKQIASGRFGVSSHYLSSARELQIKIAQGAKPGEGGQLPGHKVDSVIARLRFSTPGVTLISPPPHHDIYSIEDLAQLIFDLKNANPEAAVSVKLVAESGVGTIAAGVAKASASKIVVSGDSGGTGASPLSSIKYAGSPWELGLAEAQQALVANGLRSRVRLEVDGQLKTGADVLTAALLGADEYGFSTAPLIVEGCVMMRKCHLNTCPVGVATQDPQLRAKFQGKPEFLIRYFHFVAEEVRALLAGLGFRSLQEVIGRTDLLCFAPPERPGKARGLDLSRLLQPVESLIPGQPTVRRFEASHDPRLACVLDRKWIQLARASLEEGAFSAITETVNNSHRSLGTMLSYEVSRRHGAAGLPAETIRIRLRGTAGQSLGAFLAPGIGLELTGVANDYVGKGLSGGSIRLLSPPRNGGPLPVLAGNTCLYGATSGELFVAGAAGERFAVRNSGALAVVEEVGEHGCEYMTGGRVIVLGRTGKNFAAGMSGGIAFVYDPAGLLPSSYNPGSVDLERLEAREDEDFLFHCLQRHFSLTRSLVAAEILSAWPASLAGFTKVMPREYRRALAAQSRLAPAAPAAPPSPPGSAASSAGKDHALHA